jgi:ubiquitin C-terminal hydrolase
MNKYNLFSGTLVERKIINPFGMYNSGTICYFNSAMQCLFSCVAFTEYVLRGAYNNSMLEAIKVLLLSKGVGSDSKETNINFDFGLFNLFMSRIKNKLNDKLCYYPNFGYSQEDCCEFITILLDVINDEFVYNLFRHVYKCKLFCLTCRKSKDINDDVGYIFTIFASDIEKRCIKTENVEKRLDHKLAKYIRNNYSNCYGIKCDKCGSNNIIKTSQLVTVPTIIIISFDKYEKKYTYDYPLSLDFINNSEDRNKHIFECISTIHHNGNKNFGHYYAKCKRGDNWFELNDIGVTNISDALMPKNNTVEENVYIVVYHYISTVSY